MPFRILHISDLHRDPSAPLANGPLLESLLASLGPTGSGSTPGHHLDLVVVSGDVVHGIPADANPADLAAQYVQAEEFLVELAKETLGGNRDRLVIVPGNHDVSYPLFVSALTRVPIDNQRWPQLLRQLFEPHSRFRWDWRERSLYEIRDPTAYSERLKDFQSFYHRLYGGARNYSLDPSRQFDIFDFPDLGITLVGFSSCYLNDPWRRSGDIHPEAISGALAELRSPRYDGRVLAGVWHHSISAPPHVPDFMDEERVQLLLSNGFTLGLHGHQHRAEHVEATSRFGVEGQMMVVSAGTLCGGSNALPPGRPRSFNLLEVDPDEGEGRLRVFHAVSLALDAPIWAERTISHDGRGVWFPVERRAVEPGSHRRAVAVVLGEAQQLLADHQWDRAKAILEPHAEFGLARRLLLEAATESDDLGLIARVFRAPRSNPERIHLMHALWNLGKRSELTTLLDDPTVRDSSDPSVRETADLMRRKLKL